MMKQVVSIGVILIFLLRLCDAQHSSKFSLSLDYGLGKTLKHHPLMLFDLPQASHDLRFDLAIQTKGKHPWHSLYRYPRIGMGMMVLDYGNPEVLGKSYALYGFIDQAYFRRRRFALWGRFDHGISFHEKVFDPTNNPQQSAISSRLNLHASLGLRLEYQIHTHLKIRLGGYFSHQSNSKITKPNLGLNTAKVLGGLSYSIPSKEKLRKAPMSAEELEALKLPTWQLIPKIGLGLKEEKAHNGPKYPVYVLSFQMARNVKKKRRYLLGVEGVWDMYKAAFRTDQDITTPEIEFQTFSPSVSLGHEYLFGRIGLLTQGNVYLRQPFKRKNFWSSRVGSHLYLNSNFDKPNSNNAFIGVYIRSHTFVADYLEFALGFQF